jgi:hypothetical protein
MSNVEVFPWHQLVLITTGISMDKKTNKKWQTYAHPLSLLLLCKAPATNPHGDGKLLRLGFCATKG